jgi:hypothetical protein
MSFCKPTDEPDFKLIVDRAVAVFGVYTGATLSFYVKDFLFHPANLARFHSLSDWALYWGSWALVAVVALLLRYIIGSAVHLNRTYVPKETQKIVGTDIVATKDYQSKSLCRLFCDILFLIVFGILAFFITSSSTIEQLMSRSVYFIIAGLIWSIVALIVREKEKAIAAKWLVIDVVQIILTMGLICAPAAPIVKAVPLAVLYLGCLFFDLRVMAKPK